MQDLPEHIKELAHRLRTQDNLGTANPMFCLQVLERVYGVDPDYAEGTEWYDPNDTEAGVQPAPSDTEDTDLEEIGYKGHWSTVLVAFTREGLEEHMRQNGHNYRHYKDTRIYVDSFFRCPEMQELRKFLMEKC